MVDPTITPATVPASVANPAPNITPAAPLPWTQGTTTPAPPPANQAAPGLISSTSTAAPGSATASTVDPNALSTAMGRATDPNSLLVRQATGDANASTNSKGLLNSSLAVGEAQNAVLRAALPVAQGDVAAQESNAQANTAVSEANATNTQQSNLQNAQQKNAVATVNAQNTTSVNQSNTAAVNAQIMSSLTQANAVQMAGINTNYQSFLNNSGSASSLYNNTMQQISQIQNNPNLDAAHKTDAITQLTGLLESGLSNMSAISGLNLSAGLDFANPNTGVTATATATNTGALQTQVTDLQNQIKQLQQQQTQYSTPAWSGG